MVSSFLKHSISSFWLILSWLFESFSSSLGELERHTVTLSCSWQSFFSFSNHSMPFIIAFFESLHFSILFTFFLTFWLFFLFFCLPFSSFLFVLCTFYHFHIPRLSPKLMLLPIVSRMLRKDRVPREIIIKWIKSCNMAIEWKRGFDSKGLTRDIALVGYGSFQVSNWIKESLQSFLKSSYT